MSLLFGFKEVTLVPHRTYQEDGGRGNGENKVKGSPRWDERNEVGTADKESVRSYENGTLEV